MYNILSGLPPPNPTAPTATTTFAAQSAVHNSLPVLEEIISIAEKDESDNFNKEVNKRRMRLGAPSPEEVRKEVGREIWGISKVLLNPFISTKPSNDRYSYLFITKKS